MTKRATSQASPLVEPYLLFLAFAGVGVGTIMLKQPARLALLWTTLLVLCLVYRRNAEIDVGFSVPGLGRGALLGVVISVPLLAFLSEPLRRFNERLYSSGDVVMLYYQVCLIAAPLEEYFFRGIVQGRNGSSVSIALTAVTALLYFLPHVPFLASFIVFMAMGVLSIVYSYVREHYGLASSMACHVVVGFTLQVVPSLIHVLRQMLS